ncbi:hypothetical protein GF339_23425 [candidate division KSB3 bacterium]|uniref:ABC transporter substrate-binding protein n=1 Tax=candidate division KSB3 bacterium TaxID=2044937 RepID=A0A9D5Q832_9BACT|nr:hypothetical protein [candidate division KSB3 bacterium]MBD3327555.1 hypothetical protein [candidate division KSB3 bacterium]
MNPISTWSPPLMLRAGQLVWAVCLALLVSVSCLAQSRPEIPTVTIVQPRNINAYQEAVQGFLVELRQRFPTQFNTIIYENPRGLYTTLQQHTRSNSSPETVDLIVTVGTNATAEVSQQIRDIPVVFSMVLDPQKVLGSRQDIVGASLNIPPELQLKMIKDMLPAAKTVGIIYDPAQNADRVARYVSLADTFDLQIAAFPVSSQKEIPTALDEVNSRADLLLGIVDSTVYTSRTTEFIMRYTIREHLPFVGISVSYVKAGALYALVFDSYDIGRQTARLAAQILSGVPASELEITTPEKITIALNLRTAEIIGVTIPNPLRKRAEIIYE